MPVNRMKGAGVETDAFIRDERADDGHHEEDAEPDHDSGEAATSRRWVDCLARNKLKRLFRAHRQYLVSEFEGESEKGNPAQEDHEPDQ